MGLAIHNDQFDRQDFDRFRSRVQDQLDVLQQILRDPAFGQGPATLGAELEFYIIDHAARPLPINQIICDTLQDPQLTVELNRFNLEYNLSPQAFSDTPFGKMEAELQAALSSINACANQHGGQLVPIGILPTLQRGDFNPCTMTDIPRYRALSKALCAMRGDPFQIQIDGDPPLSLRTDDVTLEGANTSFQIHWRVPAQQFAAYFNAIQLVTPVVLALAANSPSLFGHQLWHETRIALFKQSIDHRHPMEVGWHHPPRVYFGHGWVRHSAWELFSEAVTLHEPIIPVCGQEDARARFAQGHIPTLAELRLHQGTTWPWNRAIYDDQNGGHLRIEMRALPAGPSDIDMSANALFFIGCALAVLPSIAQLTAALPFAYAEHNFYRAAKHGINATLIWPDHQKASLQDLPVLDIAQTLLPLANRALQETELNSVEIARLLEPIRGRIEQRTTGALWQRQRVKHWQQQTDIESAQRAMLADYISHYQRGTALCDWSDSR